MELGVVLFAKVNGTSVSYNVSIKVGRSHTQAFLFYAWVVAHKTNLKLVKTPRVIVTTVHFHLKTNV